MEALLRFLREKGIDAVVLGQPVLWKEEMTSEEVGALWFSVSTGEGPVRPSGAWLLREMGRYNALQESIRAFGCVQVIFAIIPIFWPILYAQRRMMRAQQRLFQERIRNALDVWEDDLEGEDFDLTSLY